MKCPKCGTKLNIGKLLRSAKPTVAQRAASAANGAKGGRPKRKASAARKGATKGGV